MGIRNPVGRCFHVLTGSPLTRARRSLSRHPAPLRVTVSSKLSTRYRYAPPAGKLPTSPSTSLGPGSLFELAPSCLCPSALSKPPLIHLGTLGNYYSTSTASADQETAAVPSSPFPSLSLCVQFLIPRPQHRSSFSRPPVYEQPPVSISSPTNSGLPESLTTSPGSGESVYVGIPQR